MLETPGFKGLIVIGIHEDGATTRAANIDRLAVAELLGALELVKMSFAQEFVE